MAMITPDQFWRRWEQGMNNAAERMRAGVQAVREAPQAAALRNVDKMRANFLRSLDSGKYASAMGRSTLQQWQQAMLQKGIPRIADGVRGAQTKVTAFANTLLQYEANLQQQVRAMPSATDADMKARMVAWYEGMKRFNFVGPLQPGQGG